MSIAVVVYRLCRNQTGGEIVERRPAVTLRARATSDLGGLGAVTAGGTHPRPRALFAAAAPSWPSASPAQVGNRLGPSDQLLERGQRLGKVARRPPRVAEQTQAHALVFHARDLVGSGEGGLGQSDGLAGESPHRASAASASRNTMSPVRVVDRRQSSGGAELVLGDVGPAGCAFGEHEREVGIDGGAGVADRLAEGECLVEPRPSEFEVATLLHDVAEKESNRRSEPRQGSESSGQHSPGSRLGLVQDANDKVELHLGDEAEGVDDRWPARNQLERGRQGPPGRLDIAAVAEALGEHLAGAALLGAAGAAARLVEGLLSERQGPDHRDPREQR